MFSALAFIVVIIGIGVPMWWKTTEVYRVSLPTAGIEHLNKVPIEISSRIGIFMNDNSRHNLIINELEQEFLQHDFLRLKFIKINLEPSEIQLAKTPASLEKIIVKKYQFTKGEFMFIEWPKFSEELLVTTDRSAFISESISWMKIRNVLKLWIFEEYNLNSILGKVKSSDGQIIRHINAPPQPKYDILISVLNPNPDLQKIHWNVRAAAEAYIQPFLDSINELSNFTLKSQWKYQVEFDYSNKQIQDSSALGRHFAIMEDTLPHIITSVERKLGTEVSKNPSIHIIVYVPPCEKSPLHIYKTGGGMASKNDVDSFFSSNWGGIIIANPDEKVCLEYMKAKQKVEFHLSSQKIMPIGLYLLRKIFGLQNDIPISGASMTELETIAPRIWEIDTYIRTRVVHLIASATITLNSLIKLLGDISYIVINDDVGNAINVAYENIVQAKFNLKNGNLDQAIYHAKVAFANSEKAFFDPSLLALLYFPDEQKYAIYIPLFLPITIPVILSLGTINRFRAKLMGKRSASTESEKNKKETDEELLKNKKKAKNE